MVSSSSCIPDWPSLKHNTVYLSAEKLGVAGLALTAHPKARFTVMAGRSITHSFIFNSSNVEIKERKLSNLTL